MGAVLGGIAGALFGRMIKAGTDSTIGDLERKNARQAAKIVELAGTIAVAKVRHEENVKKDEAKERQICLLEGHCEKLSAKIDELVSEYVPDGFDVKPIDEDPPWADSGESD